MIYTRWDPVFGKAIVRRPGKISMKFDLNNYAVWCIAEGCSKQKWKGHLSRKVPFRQRRSHWGAFRTL